MGWNRQILRQPPNMGTQKWVAWHLTLKKISSWSGLVMIDGWWWLTFLRRNQWRKTGVGTVFFGHFFQIQGPTNEVIFLSSKPPYFTEPNSDPCPISPAVGFCCSFWQSDFGQPDIGGEAPFTWVRWLISRRMKAYSSSTIDCAMVSSLNDTPLPCCEHIRSICWFSSQWSYGWGEDPGM